MGCRSLHDRRFGRNHRNHIGESSQKKRTYVKVGPKVLSGSIACTMAMGLITWQPNTIILVAVRLLKQKKYKAEK